MRKYLYAGAVAGGFLLLGAAPAHADVVPIPPGQQQDGTGAGGLLGGDSPLGNGRVLDVTPGDNSADLRGASGSVLPDLDQVPAARTGLGKATDRAPAGAARPAADRLGSGLPLAGLLSGGGLGGGLPLAGGGLPLAGGGIPLAGGGIPFAGGGMPLAGGGLPFSSGRAAGAQESGLLGDHTPLLGGLGGLGGLLPSASARTLPAVSGMPAGGTAVPAPAADAPANRAPVTDTPVKPAAKPAADPATANDQRLHEEPVDPEGATGRTDTRRFSDGRPVAGPDPDYR
jgi:hypothetical protein